MSAECSCNVEAAISFGGEHENSYGETYDTDDDFYYLRCPIHEKDKKEPWLVGTVEEFSDLTHRAGTRLTSKGLKAYCVVLKAYAEKHPELKRLAEIELRINELILVPKSLMVPRIDLFTGEQYRIDWFQPQEVSLERERLHKEKERLEQKIRKKEEKGEIAWIDPWFLYRAFGAVRKTPEKEKTHEKSR